MDTILCIGVDVSSRTFEASLSAEAAKSAQFPNNEAGFAAFAAWCGEALANALVVCEATGGYEAAFIGFLVARGVRVHRATPYLVKPSSPSCAKSSLSQTQESEPSIVPRLRVK